MPLVPYRPGGGATSFDFDREPTASELLAVNGAGREASAVAADLIALRSVAAGATTARDALRHLGLELCVSRPFLSPATACSR